MIRCKWFTALLLIAFFSPSILVGVEQKRDPDAVRKAVIRLQKSVAFIQLKENNQLLKGKIIGFRGKGILFDPERSGPFYDPKTRYYPLKDIAAFLDAHQQVLWKNPQAAAIHPKPSFRPLPFHALIGVGGGLGTYFQSYENPGVTFSTQRYAREVSSGLQWQGQMAYVWRHRLAIGFKYQGQRSTASYFGTAPHLGDTSVELSEINDAFVVHSLMFQLSYLRRVKSRAVFHLDGGVGRATLLVDGGFMLPPEPFHTHTLCLSGATGLDFFVTRQLALGFELSLFWGNASLQEANGVPLSFEQSLNRMDINIGVKYYF